MIRLDNDEMNMTPEVSAFLGYTPARRRREAMALALSAPRRPGPDGPDVIAVLGWIIGGTFAAFVAAVVGVVLLSAVCFVVSIAEGPTAGTMTIATTSANTQISQTAPSTPRAQRRPIVSQPASAASVAYLPAEYDFGCLQPDPHLRFIWLHDRMPRGFAAEDLTTPLPLGTCVLFERQNANGWRRVVSFDGKYRGYAQLFPTSSERRPMHPLFTRLIPLLRQIP